MGCRRVNEVGGVDVDFEVVDTCKSSCVCESPRGSELEFLHLYLDSSAIMFITDIIRDASLAKRSRTTTIGKMGHCIVNRSILKCHQQLTDKRNYSNFAFVAQADASQRKSERSLPSLSHGKQTANPTRL